MITNNLVPAILGAFLILLAVWLLLITIKVNKISKHTKAIAKAGENRDFVRVVENSLLELSFLRNGVDKLIEDHNKLAVEFNSAIQRVGVVRFDAFADTGGKRSFAVALLDNHYNGVVVSTINGREESRSYAKPIRGRESEYNLSVEELAAISEALGDNVGSKI